MTLVLAIRCREGIVLASDGQRVADGAGQPTKHASRKLFDLGGSVAWGAAGSVGLQQSARDRLAGIDRLEVGDATAARARLVDAIVPVQQEALRQYVAHPGTDPPGLACLFCGVGAAGPWILEIPPTGGDHQLHERYSAIGSGDIFARFAMASIAHLGTDELDLEQAKMVAFKATADAISVAALFLGPPIQMYTITRAGARRVPREELDGGLSDSVDAWRARQREALGPLATSADDEDDEVEDDLVESRPIAEDAAA
jgi:20S proteasome alpha/beta subunit